MINYWQTGELKFDVLKEHALGVTSVAYSPDGKQLASGSWDNTIRFWDVKTGKPIRLSDHPYLEGLTLSVLSVAYSPDGKQLASGSWDNTIRLWDVKYR